MIALAILAFGRIRVGVWLAIAGATLCAGCSKPCAITRPLEAEAPLSHCYIPGEAHDDLELPCVSLEEQK